MPRLAIATTAVGEPMGAQVYEGEIARRAAGALAGSVAHAWKVDHVVVRSVRSRLPGNRRLPMGPIGRAGATARRHVGRLIYPRGALVHRMNLELPPAPLEVVTLHDVVAWKYADESAPVRTAAEELRRAAAVVCVSHFSAGEAVDLLGIDEPHVVHNGVSRRFLDAEPATVGELAGLGVTRPYVLHAGGAARRKNLEALAAAWPHVRSACPGVDLVLSGPPHRRRDELFAGLRGVHRVGRLPDALVPGLVAAAAAVVVPSLHEGFGLPALEAMAAGVPLVAADTSSLPEVVGDGGVLVAPTGPAIAEGLVWALSGDGEIAAMVGRGRARAELFTWEYSAAGHAAVWAQVV
jgi:glycosyltransferase involved in cell wall biosynthesis